MPHHSLRLRSCARRVAAVLLGASSLLACGRAGAAVVINEIYTAGGNSGATYKTEYYELYNNGVSPQSIAGWRLEYYFAAGTSPNTTLTVPAAVTLGAGQYYLIAGQTGATGAALPVTPDQTSTLDANTT